ncbi:FKBP-type peptidyl-prolyl cis-trans isomerase [Rickettsia endosymbiont of Halotydeus destructor]|uniref:FKBP-type peptidyl-prolyl cis-trans isomerase n=1 Tax=Rickettsia endosymbiont of Halotydeus destructor TaxID=2996754 RepID=UPI003BB1ED03
MQKLLTLLIVILILYNIVKIKSSSSLNDNPKEQATTDNITGQNQSSLPAEPNSPLTGNLIEKTISKVIINALKTEEGRVFFENLLQPLNKPLDTENYTIEVHKDLVTPLFKINTIGTGNIGPASCGHLVTVYYQLSDIDNNLLTEDTKTFTLGSRAILPGMDSVIVGMMVGQTRTAIIPAKYAYYNQEYQNKNIDPNSPFRLNVVLKSILPQNFISSNEVKIFDDEIAYRMPLLCGEKVVFDAKITRLSDGKILYNSKLSEKKIDMKIGDITYPLIFSYALHGKVPVGTRTVIAKGRNFKATGSNLNKIIYHESLPLEEYLMLELSNFSSF